MSKYVMLFLSVALLFVHTAVFGSEIRNLGADALRTQDATEALHTYTPPQDISVYYENDVAYPRWQYADNVEAYRAIAKTVKDLSKRQTSFTVIVEGAASPVGSEAYNFRLALRRANILRDIIYRMEGGDKLKIRTISAGEDWATFQSYVEMMYHEPNRESVLAILRTKISNDDKERRLQALDKGYTWRKLVREFMASSRNAAVIHIVEIDDLAPKSPSMKFQPTIAPIKSDAIHSSHDELFDEPIDTTQVSQTKQITPPRKPVVAVRSNLLVPALNVGVEVPIGTNWSIGADYYYPWVWPKKDNKDCFELLAWGIEGRYWFGKSRTVFDRLQGHSLGLYGYMGYYDFERNFHGHQGEFVNIGVDYTYAMAVGKKKSVYFEFSLGVGYIYSQARKYTVIEAGSPLISDKITKKIGYFGPTKANISLVVPIFQKVKHNDKQRGNE
ncbi:MAG: DUF3575 domain-containing protein [Alistipes sp.]|nr:DUF3575 domain-containing protein [Alistipes sp.]